ncbi:unnamed protein product [Cuscuta campestris]|uniref:Uncharacterized protein n=1 Tax=Cuscuta campestris TaxID=132261 RepID=A0A484MJQ4_9ASTE|nr:unnamed protein product [Cuscuta campestris]
MVYVNVAAGAAVNAAAVLVNAAVNAAGTAVNAAAVLVDAAVDASVSVAAENRRRMESLLLLSMFQRVEYIWENGFGSGEESSVNRREAQIGSIHAHYIIDCHGSIGSQVAAIKWCVCSSAELK